MRYVYYPGCSLEAAGRPYDESVRAVFARLGIAVDELAGWNCCGGSTYLSVDEGRAFALAARNLCLAEQGRSDDVHMVAPCSACYLFHLKTQAGLQAHDERARIVSEALAAEGYRYAGRVRVRHPLDVLRNDAGLERVGEAVTRPLHGLKVACYYGCQVVRPWSLFDDPREPASMDDLLRAAGAEPVTWPLKTRCCGGSLTGTVEEAGLRLGHILLREARRRGAEVVATACPLCQFNLECYQGRMERRFGERVTMPVVYFTQLLGRAMGIPDRSLGLHRHIGPLPRVRTAEEVPA
jgi:heterodisulfide reductase subunit B